MADQEQTERGASIEQIMDAVKASIAKLLSEEDRAPLLRTLDVVERLVQIVGDERMEAQMQEAYARGLKADLERVTAEASDYATIIEDIRAENRQIKAQLAEAKERIKQLEAGARTAVVMIDDLQAERDAMREVCSNVIGPHISDKMHSPRDCQRCKFNDGVAVVLDATRKATADATDEGK